MAYQQYGAPQGYGQPPPGQPPPGQYGQPPPGQPPPGQYGQPPGQYGQPPPAQYGQPPPAQYGQPPPAQYGQPPPAQYGQPQYGYGAPVADDMMVPFMQAAGPDGVISAEELVGLLTATGLSDYPRKGGRFSLETCRLMIAMLDANGNQCLDFNEFMNLVKSLDAWKDTFKKHDTDMSGSIEHHELQGVFVALGYNMSPAATDTCIKRYSKKSNRQISFDDFIACAIRVRALSAAFRDRDAAQQGFAQLQYDDFMRMVMRL